MAWPRRERKPPPATQPPDERGWRATFYTTGMEHSPTSAAGTGCGLYTRPGFKGAASIKRRRSDVNYKSINFQQKFGLFNEQWLPKVVAEMNDYQFKVVKLQGDFILARPQRNR
jgi:hypothetical protein